MKRIIKQLNRRIKFLCLFLLYIILSYTIYAQKPELIIQLGHSEEINCLSFSKDNKFIATGSSDNSIKLWELKSGKELKTFSGHSRPITCIVFNPDGNILASGSEDKSIKLWDIDSGKVIQTFSENSGIVKSISFSLNGNLLAAGISDGTINIWSITTGEQISSYKANNSKITSICFSPDSKLLLCGSEAGTLKMWDIGSDRKKEATSFIGHTGTIRSVAFNPDNKTIASGGDDSTIRIWDISNQKQIKIFSGNMGIVTTIFFNYNGKYLASGNTDEIIRIWDVPKGKIFGILPGFATCINSIFINKDWKTFACLGNDFKTLRICRIENGKEIKKLAGHSMSVNAATIDPKGAMLATGSSDNILRLWNISSGKGFRKLIGHSAGIRTVAISPDGKLLASGSDDNTIKLWDLTSTVKEIKTLKGHSSMILSLAFSHDGKLLASGSGDKLVKVWDISSSPDEWKEVLNLSGFFWSVKSLCFSNDGKILVTGGDNIRLWELSSGEEIQNITTHKALINSITYSPDGKMLASGSLDKTIKLWNVKSNGELKEIETLEGHTDWVRSVCFSPDGKLLVSGGGDKSVIIWDMKKKKEIRKIIGYSSDITSICFSPDGKYFITGSGDGKLKIIEVPSGNELANLIALDQKDWALVTPDGKFDGSVQGMKLLYYTQDNQTIPLDAFFEEFYSPRLLRKIISTPSMASLSRSPSKVDLSKKINLPTFIRILSPKYDEKFASEKIKIRAEFTDLGGGIDEIRLYHNDKLYLEEKPELKPDYKQKIERSFNVVLVPGLNEFRVTALDQNKIESSESFTLDFNRVIPTCNLFLFVIGIDKYENEKYNLNYGRADAEGFLQTVEENGKPIFKKINKYEIYDQKATRKEIETTFLKIIAEVKPTDVFVFYYAGHGVMIEDSPGKPGDFYLVLQDITQIYGKEEILQKKSISSKYLKELCKKIKSQKQLIVLDACQSGGALQSFASRGAAEERAIHQLARSAGVIIMASSGSEQFAAEISEIKHGIFTYALIKGLEGEADGGKEPDKKITVKELESYINDIVPELSQKYKGSRQYPNSFTIGQDFPISIVK